MNTTETSQTQKILASGTKVKIKIRNKHGYTKELYDSIQGKEGFIIRKMELISASYEDAYLIEFDETTTQHFYETSGNWSQSTDKKMAWWTDRKDFKII